MPAPAGRIDVHHHVLPLFYQEAQRAGGITGTAYRPFPEWSPEHGIAMMDRHDIATAILSFSSPGMYYGDLAATRELTRRCNDYLAEPIAERPQRFGGFATLPLPDVDAALEEIARALDDLKLDGIVLLTSVGDVHIGHEDFEPIYEELNRRGAVVFIHPAYPPPSQTRGWEVPRAFVDYPFETTRVATNLLFKGVLERRPDIKWILSHAGGTLPMLAHRLEIFDGLTKFSENYPKGARHYFQRLYYDVALCGDAPPLAALQALADPTRILFGTDFPYIPDDRVAAEVAGVDGYAGFDAESRPLMERGNALRLFPRLAG